LPGPAFDCEPEYGSSVEIVLLARASALMSASQIARSSASGALGLEQP